MTTGTVYVVEVSGGNGDVTREEFRTEREAESRCAELRAAGVYAGWSPVSKTTAHGNRLYDAGGRGVTIPE